MSIIFGERRHAPWLMTTAAILASSMFNPAQSLAQSLDGTPISGAARDNRACPSRELVLNGAIEARSATAIVGLFPCWDADESNGQFRYMSDLYAHWTVREIRDPKSAFRNYGGEHRPALLRLFVGRNLSLISSIRIDLRDPDMTFIIPLASFSYEGRVGKGESWSTNLVGDDQTQPFFRIGPTTSAKINLSAKTTSDLEVKAAGTILGALRGLTAVVSPGSGLITTLNRESLQQTSNALDNALSSIWSESRDEQQISGRQLSEWYEPAGYIVQLELPDYLRTTKISSVRDRDGVEKLKPLPTQRTTRWYYLSLSCPRYSIFDPKQACANPGDTADPGLAGIGSENIFRQGEAIKKRISAQQVNNFKLTAGKTIHEFLSGQDWYSSFLRKSDTAPGNQKQKIDTTALPAAVAGAPAPPSTATGEAVKTVENARTDNDYAALCNSIVDSLYSVGLSSLDARIALWATITGSPDFVGVNRAVQSNEGCRAMIPPGFGYFIQLPLEAAAESAKPAPKKATTAKKPAKKK